jgi:predicted dehydrogenase
MIRYNHEFERRLRTVYLGCGDHSFRNILPCFRYAPIDLVAVCDQRGERAEAFARQFGAPRHYTDYEQMLAREAPEAVFIVTGYDAQGRPTYPPLAEAALRAGACVWMEKPPAATTAEIRRLQAAAAETGRFVMVGLKKAFFPAVARAREIARSPEFGPLSSIVVRYPQSLPSQERRGDSKAMLGFLDHLCHPASILYSIAGPVESLFYQREKATGAVAANLRFRSGAVGLLHLCAGQSGTGALERLEVVGQGSHVVVENGCRLLHYRRGRRGEGGYGRSASFIGPDDGAPILWEPEFSLGQLYNNNLFLLGYAPEILHFCESALAGTPPVEGNLEAALEVTRLYEGFLQPEGTVIRLPEEQK